MVDDPKRTKDEQNHQELNKQNFSELSSQWWSLVITSVVVTGHHREYNDLHKALAIEEVTITTCGYNHVRSVVVSTFRTVYSARLQENLSFHYHERYICTCTLHVHYM